MIADYWRLGEAVQDAVIDAGYDADTVEGIAVDIHDMLQAADLIRDELAKAVVESSKEEMVSKLKLLQWEFDHIKWHCEAASTYINAAIEKLKS